MGEDLLARAESVRETWKLAIDKGYFDQAITEYTVPEFTQFMAGLLPGLLLALMVPIVGQVGGSVVGAALGSLIGPEGTLIGSRVGQVLGGAAATFVLLKMGLDFLREFVLPKVGMVGEHLGKGVMQAWDAGGWGTVAKARLQDEAAKEIATGIGVLFGLLLMALVLMLIKDPTEGMVKIRNSFIGKTCRGFADWLQVNLKWLQERYQNGPTRIPGGGKAPTALEKATERWKGQAAALGITEFEAQVLDGAVDAATKTALETARSAVKQILPYLVSKSRTVLSKNVGQIDASLTKFGFRLIRAEPYGPNGGSTGWQLFWQKGNVLIRFKTTGENAGPRQGKPHLSIGYNDGLGLQWQNDLAKFTSEGDVVAKVIADPAKFNPTDFQGNPQKFVLLPTNFDISAVDAWAAKTHFNADGTFSLTGLEAILKQAGVTH